MSTTTTEKNTLLSKMPFKRNDEAIMDAYLEALGRLQHLYNMTGHPDFGETVRKMEAALGRKSNV